MLKYLETNFYSDPHQIFSNENAPTIGKIMMNFQILQNIGYILLIYIKNIYYNTWNTLEE